MTPFALVHRPPAAFVAGLFAVMLALRPSAPTSEPTPHVRVVVVPGHLRGDIILVPKAIDTGIARPAVRDLDPKIFVRLSDVTVTRRP
jgi:hypothetical protein